MAAITSIDDNSTAIATLTSRVEKLEKALEAVNADMTIIKAAYANSKTSQETPLPLPSAHGRGGQTKSSMQSLPQISISAKPLKYTAAQKILLNTTTVYPVLARIVTEESMYSGSIEALASILTSCVSGFHGDRITPQPSATPKPMEQMMTKQLKSILKTYSKPDDSKELMNQMKVIFSNVLDDAHLQTDKGEVSDPIEKALGKAKYNIARLFAPVHCESTYEIIISATTKSTVSKHYFIQTKLGAAWLMRLPQSTRDAIGAPSTEFVSLPRLVLRGISPHDSQAAGTPRSRKATAPRAAPSAAASRGKKKIADDVGESDEAIADPDEDEQDGDEDGDALIDGLDR